MRHRHAQKTTFFHWNRFLALVISVILATLWPLQLSAERAFAAVSPAFTVKPNNQSVNGDLVQSIQKTTSDALSFTYRGTTYRALHTIQAFRPQQGRWQNVSLRLSQDQNASSDGFEVDAITAVSPGPVWYAGTLIGKVSIGRPNGAWSQTSTTLPERTVTALCQLVGDGGQVAAVGYGGYRSATPATPGHVYVTLDEGKHWFDISNNLPDVPVKSLRFASIKNMTQLQVNMDNTWYGTSVDGNWQTLH